MLTIVSMMYWNVAGWSKGTVFRSVRAVVKMTSGLKL